MVDAKKTASWMLSQIESDGCIYQDDVVDFLIRTDAEGLLRENADGNPVLGREVLAEFKKLNATGVVWVKPDRYWRYRVPEDEPGRAAGG